MNYGYKRELNTSFAEAIEKVKEELSKEGFGILSEINVGETLKEKLNVDFKKYIILGACSPKLAHKALLSEEEIGLFLPCNVIIYENLGKIYVSAILPTVAMGMIENDSLADIAREAEEKLKKVVNMVVGSGDKKNLCH